jgi:hypothetical protein
MTRIAKLILVGMTLSMIACGDYNPNADLENASQLTLQASNQVCFGSAPPTTEQDAKEISDFCQKPTDSASSEHP